MKTNYLWVDEQSDSNVSTGHFTNWLLKGYPAESIPKERDMEDWWDRRAGGWTPDKIAV
jgi:hypothetical protein